MTFSRQQRGQPCSHLRKEREEVAVSSFEGMELDSGDEYVNGNTVQHSLYENISNFLIYTF